MNTTNPIPQPRTLYLRLTDSKICFARYEVRREPFFSFSNFVPDVRSPLAANLREAQISDEVLLAPISKVNVLVPGKIVAVPLSHFREEDCESIWQNCCGKTAEEKEKRERVFYDVVPHADIVLLFAVNETICRAVENTFDCEVHYVSGTTSLLRHFAEKPDPSDCSLRLFAYCHEHTAEISAMREGGRIVSINSYHIEAASDVTYYIASLLQQLSAGADETASIYIVGDETEIRDAVCTELRDIMPHVYAVNPSAEFNRHIVATTPGVPYDLINLLIY